jgi:hypothetical protein
MEVWGGSATQYEESEKYIVSLSPLQVDTLPVICTDDVTVRKQVWFSMLAVLTIV